MKKSEKKFRFPLTMFGSLVLVIVLALLFQTWRGKPEPLFDNNTTTTYYAKTTVGLAPQLDPGRLFSSETYDRTKFQLDVTQYDWNIPGFYRVPILYDGKKTNCVVQVEVKSLDDKETETVPDMNKDTAITGSK